MRSSKTRSNCRACLRIDQGRASIQEQTCAALADLEGIALACRRASADQVSSTMGLVCDLDEILAKTIVIVRNGFSMAFRGPWRLKLSTIRVNEPRGIGTARLAGNLHRFLSRRRAMGQSRCCKVRRCLRRKSCCALENGRIPYPLYISRLFRALQSRSPLVLKAILYF